MTTVVLMTGWVLEAREMQLVEMMTNHLVIAWDIRLASEVNLAANFTRGRSALPAVSCLQQGTRWPLLTVRTLNTIRCQHDVQQAMCFADKHCFGVTAVPT